jgi:hypothetical protein
MKCPKCGYFSPDYLDNCKKCGKDLLPEKAKLGLVPPKISNRSNLNLKSRLTTSTHPFFAEEAQKSEAGANQPSPEKVEPPAFNSNLRDINFEELQDDWEEPSLRSPISPNQTEEFEFPEELTKSPPQLIALSGEEEELFREGKDEVESINKEESK